jgi:hypothetical protein
MPDTGTQPPRPAARRVDASRLMLGLLALLFVAYSTIFTILAPGRRWMNHVGGVPLWPDNDPGGWYIGIGT